MKKLLTTSLMGISLFAGICQANAASIQHDILNADLETLYSNGLDDKNDLYRTPDDMTFGDLDSVKWIAPNKFLYKDYEFTNFSGIVSRQEANHGPGFYNSIYVVNGFPHQPPILTQWNQLYYSTPGIIAEINRIDNNPFNFNDPYFTSELIEGLPISIKGYLNGQLVLDDSLITTIAGSTNFGLWDTNGVKYNCIVDKITLSAEGNFVMDAPVPEPSSMALGLLSLAGILSKRRKKQ